MNNVMINNIPSANRKDFGYKNKNESHVHNENQKEVLDDILDLFNKANAIERIINENMDYIKYENSNLEVTNNMILDKISILQNNYEELKNDRISRKVTAMPSICKIYDETFGAIIDKKTSGIMTRPSKKISKFAIFDDISDSMYLPDSLSVTLLDVSTNGIVSKADNDIYAPFYKDNNLYWTRRTITDSTVEFIDTEYVITLPEDIMTTPEMNEIYIHPFMCKILNVYCRYGDSTTWESVQGQDFNPGIYNVDDNNTDDLDKTIRAYKPIRLNFPNKKINQIKILIRCDSYTEGQTNLRTFMYGIKEIGGYINYYSNYEPSSFEFEREIPEPPISKNYVITGIKPYFNNGSEFGIYSRDFNYEIFYKDNNDVFHKITDSFPFTPPTNKIKVRCKFGEGYNDINIKKIDVTYKIIE